MTGVDVGMRRLGTPCEAAGFHRGKAREKEGRLLLCQPLPAAANLWELLSRHFSFSFSFSSFLGFPHSLTSSSHPLSSFYYPPFSSRPLPFLLPTPLPNPQSALTSIYTTFEFPF